jgi:hypothetical protein
MQPSKAHRSSRAAAKRGRISRERTAPRPPARTRNARDAWITDPHSLLAALESAERGAQKALEQAGHVVEIRHELACAPALPEKLAVALPPLRTDERIGRASSAGAVVIIRRRRAA